LPTQFNQQEMKCILFTILSLILFLQSKILLAHDLNKAGSRPINVLLITSDDLGKQLSCYDDDIIQTPNIDKLAERGFMFHNAYVSQASCSSSRSSILTGTYPHTNGQLGLAHHGFELNKEYPNIASVLKQKGYKTGIIGKLHVNPVAQFPFDFDRKNYLEARDVEMVACRVDSFLSMSGKEPFFLYVNYSDPHVPFYREFNGHPTREVNSTDVHSLEFQGVNDPQQLQRIADYYCCVRRLDEGIGLLMEKLEKNGVLQNTLIIFVSDHGAAFARGKAASYESSLNMPYFVSCPSFIKAKQVSRAMVSTVDIFPTILNILNIAIPSDVQGISILPILKNEKTEVRNYLFAEFNYHLHSLASFYPQRVIRDDRYKLIFNLPSSLIFNGNTSIDGDEAYQFSQASKYDGTWVREAFNRLNNPPSIELFDLYTDPYEKIDLSGNPDFVNKREELLQQLLTWMENTNDPFLKKEDMEREIMKLKINN
jgi:N-sulfoglucosamine sulfohydrolase